MEEFTVEVKYLDIAVIPRPHLNKVPMDPEEWCIGSVCSSTGYDLARIREPAGLIYWFPWFLRFSEFYLSRLSRKVF